MSNIHTLDELTRAHQDTNQINSFKMSFALGSGNRTGTLTKTETKEKAPTESDVDDVSNKLEIVDLSTDEKQPTESSFDNDEEFVPQVNETNASHRNEASASHENKTNEIAENGVSFSHLNEEQKDNLSSWVDLNSTSGIPRWQFIVDSLFTDSKERTRIIATLSCARSGGGNPAYNFLMHLKGLEDSPTKEKFCQVAKDCKRFDIPRLSFIEAVSDTSLLLGNLALFDTLNLAAELTPKGFENGWKHFADKFGLTKDEKDKIAATIATGNVCSPTKMLIEILIEKGINTGKVKAACKKLDFNNTVKKLEKIEVEISKRT